MDEGGPPELPRIPSRSKADIQACGICGEPKELISRALGICTGCIRERPREALPYIREAHRKARARHGLPAEPPRTDGGVECGLCSNRCLIGEGEKGYCGLRWNEGGLRSRVGPSVGLLYAYLDPHVTNCSSAWFCPGGTGAGYPTYANLPGPEIGFYNLAVFFYGCNFDCLFCQNASHKDLDGGGVVEAEAFAKQIADNPRVSCVCFFGGSPEPQLPFSVGASRRALQLAKERPLRVCFEWNGCGDPSLVREAAELALESGGNLKFDLKCFTPSLSLALSGVENKQAYRNFARIAEEYYPERPEAPLLTATTLLVPGHVDGNEVSDISSFISALDRTIPYSLLIFHPRHMMSDMPVTPLRQAAECYRAARRHLERVHVGNLHLLGIRDMRHFISVADGL